MTEATTESEIELLNGYLNAYRGAIRWKVEGLSRDEATRSMVPSGTSLLGIVKHMAQVERFWFQHVIEGRAIESPPEGDEFRALEGETIEEIVAAHAVECATSQTILANHELTETVTLRDETLSIRDIVVHMIEETARHCGHMDILREQIDGATGGFAPDSTPSS